MYGKLTLRDFDKGNQPRERLVNKGSEALSDVELMAIILRSGGKHKSVLDISYELLKKHGNLVNIFQCDLEQLAKEKYIGRVKAITIIAVLEISKRIHLANKKEYRYIHKPKDAFQIVKKELFGKRQEHLYLISLDTRKRFLSKDLICIGSVNETLIPVREIIQKALLKDAVNIILVHNHPSKDPSPSKEDLVITEKIAKACQLTGLSLLDHIITADNEFASIKSLDLFNSEKLSNERR